MEKSHKNSNRSNSLRNWGSSIGRSEAKTAARSKLAAVFVFALSISQFAGIPHSIAQTSVSQAAEAASPAQKTSTKSSAAGKQAPSKEAKSTGQLETYQDIIQKAQNLTLQRDRLQTSQVLLRAIQREAKNSTAHRELIKTLDELTGVFYTERAQGAFTAGESLLATRPKDAIEPLQEALRIEEGNVSALKALARAHLMLSDCDKAEAYVKSAETLNPYSPQIKLLRIQVLDCSKSSTLLAAKLATLDPDLEPLEKYMKGIQLRELVRKQDLKKAKTLLSAWEAADPTYPEVYYWKWELSKVPGPQDRTAAARYSQLCQNLSPRKRKSYTLDVDLCKGKEAVETFLRETALQPAEPGS